MGYELHITRKEHWFDDEGLEISLSEWLKAIESDPELRFDGFAEARLPSDHILRVDDPSMAVWIKNPDHNRNSDMAWIWRSNGNIEAKNPDNATRKKMWQIAQIFGAKLQGDEGECYDSCGAVETLQPDTFFESSKIKKWWHFW